MKASNHDDRGTSITVEVGLLTNSSYFVVWISDLIVEHLEHCMGAIQDCSYYEVDVALVDLVEICVTG